MRLTLGISPCPNDTFIFDALANVYGMRSLAEDLALGAVRPSPRRRKK